MTSIHTIISDIVAAMRTKSGLLTPYFEAGRIEYIIDKIAEKGQNASTRSKILPMIALIGDIKEDITDGVKNLTVPILFAVETKPETPNPTRITTTFVTLYDLLEDFNTALGLSNAINMTYPDFTKIDSAFYSGVTNKISVYTDVLVCEYKIEVIEDCISTPVISTVQIVVSAEAGGTTIPDPATYTAAYKNNYPFYASPSTGYTFSRWLKNGVATIVNPINLYADIAYTLVAEFVAGIVLTMTKTGLGTVTPAEGSHTYTLDELVDLTAPDELVNIFC